ncbi:MAG: hypothetical protein ACXWX4_01160 [Actinomycetota bacterium]
MVPIERLATVRNLVGAALAAGLAVVLVVAMAAGGSGDPSTGASSTSVVDIAPADQTANPEPLDPSWPTRLTLLSDSVGLGSIDALRETLPRWRVRVLGRPALMLDDAAVQLQRGDRLDEVVVVALGYNSLWRRNRVDYDYFASRFDREAARLVRVIRAKGGRKIVWVTLREASRPNVPPDGREQHATYAWYFPYVNERLDRLDRRFGDVVLADWAKISNRTDITYDAFHLDPDGALLYSRLIRRTVLRTPYEPPPTG